MHNVGRAINACFTFKSFLFKEIPLKDLEYFMFVIILNFIMYNKVDFVMHYEVQKTKLLPQQKSINNKFADFTSYTVYNY